jgi:Alpha/beta hydrolase
MTAPVDPRVAAAAASDVPLLRGAVATLTAVAGRLTAWRVRVEAVGRALEVAEVWSGPAAREAAAAVVQLSTVAVGVSGGTARSLEAFERLAAEAAAAAELALVALVVPASPATGEALRHAARASVAAGEAGVALAGLGVVDAAGPATFAALADAVGCPVTVPPPPAGSGPADVAAWWTALSAAAQQALISARPEVVGALGGVPAWARDRANRLLLHRLLAEGRLPAYQALTARAVDRELGALDRAGEPAQLHTLDLAGDRVAMALGDVDTADAVAVLVPGIMTVAVTDLGRWVGNGHAVTTAAHQARRSRTAAALVWLGYRTPRDVPSTVTRFAARRGGADLAADLAGLAAARTAGGRPPARTTVVAHSYGTVVVDEAADEPGRLAADAVVLLGSPGMEDDAASLEAPEVHVGAAPADPVSWVGWFGVPPWALRYGATPLPADPATGHSHWFDPDRPTLAAIGRVVAAQR